MTRPRLDIAFYGDDLTGSTDVLEALSLFGVRTRLFLDIPNEAEIASLDGIRAVGVAGESRAMSPDWMDRHLPRAFEALKALGAPIVHYKVCSTFDSSPRVGSIGRVLEIGLRVFGCGVVPIIVGVPYNGRYTAFGHLFATAFGRPAAYRIDRHPVMAQHPRTPMDEADLIRHLARQTDCPVHLVDFRSLQGGDTATALIRQAAESGPCGVLIDVLDEATSEAAGRLLRARLWTVPTGFVIGSSGVEYALMDAEGRTRQAMPPPGSVDRLLVVSGSCSPTTAAQIDDAERRGWAVIDLDPRRLLDNPGATVAWASRASLEALDRGCSTVVATARGTDGAEIAAVTDAAERAEINTAERFGTALGEIAATAAREIPALKRLMVAGGDTSSMAGRALGVRALDMVAPVVPGSPLCRVVSGDRSMIHRELVFKGGQIGRADHFERVRLGLTADEPISTNAAA